MDYQEKLRSTLRMRYEKKQILILGFGREGRTTYHFLRRLLPEQVMAIMDANEISPKEDIFWIEEKQAYDDKLVILTGQEYLKNLNSFDLIFKTPGLPAFHLQGVDKSKITSQTNEFVCQVGERTIGITGTKGKSTTSSIVFACLQALGLDVLLVGNIGKPALELLLEDTPNRYYVYEMSSHQTQFLRYAPRVAGVLNLFEEHLDNYVDYEEYKQAKLTIGSAVFKQKADYPTAFLYGCDNAELMSYQAIWQDCRHYAFGDWKNRPVEGEGVFLKEKEIVLVKAEQSDIANQVLSQSKKLSEKELGSSAFSRNLLGRHNLVNALVAFLVVEEIMGLTEERIATIFQVIADFKGLEHRLEFVSVQEGIAFYNDSISTIPAATMQAIAAIPDLQTLIIGGFDRGIHYEAFVQELNGHRDLKIICLPHTGHKVYEGLLHDEKYKVNTMAEAVTTAFKITEIGKACVLSPAAASYTFYKNFEERGADFKEKVATLGRRDLSNKQ